MSGNPIGNIHEEQIKCLVRQLADKWLEEKAQTPKPRWWQFWKNREMVHKGVKFLLDCLDVLVEYVDDLMDAGPDKKATVLAAMAALYDLVIVDLLPIWFKPFAAGVKQFFIYTLVSLAIDFIVKKYNEGAWKKETNAQNRQAKTM